MPNYPYYYQPYQPYQPPMADQLMQLRQNQYQPNMQQVPQQQVAPSIVWVQNEMEAANYLVALWNELRGPYRPRRFQR